PDLPASVPQAVHKLVGFSRVSLRPHETRTVTLHVTAEQLSSWSDVAGAWVLGTGKRSLFVGSSSRDPQATATFTVR
ncbi:MAG TPA: fibronectin type III-like domain-contianing protein, partial [Pseudonocardiaceae bacterium]|nr:fibronectin type III-like domain-contianing protein [Pseudonocardiaceae bacterium]